ncbi:MAG: preprotein translocase subunit SecE [Bacteroidales bacterium]|nr:preprotein translocase subunit SecE [Bacteroidales bacterium]
MKKLLAYIKDTYNEMLHKVSWPTWAELQESAIVVSVASLIIAVIVLVMDLVFKFGLEAFYSIF